MKRRFAALDSWRGICALFVATFHYAALSHVVAWPFVRHSWLFVDFFFVLSGFVISHAYQDRLRNRHEAGSFLIRRFGRVWPLHAVILPFFVLLELLKLHLVGHGMTAQRPPFSGTTSVPLLIASIFLVQGLGASTWSWNGPSWSISVEFWTYVIFAAGCVASSTLGGLQRRRSVVLFGPLMLIAAIALLLIAGTMDTQTRFGMLRCLYGYLLGHLTYLLWHARSGEGPSGAGWELAIVMIVALFVAFAGFGAWSFLAPPIFALAVWVFANEQGALSGLMKQRWALALGRWSFSIYMTHWLVREGFNRIVGLAERKLHMTLSAPANFVDEPGMRMLAIGGPWGGDAMLVVFLGVVVAISAFTYRWVELPGQRLSARLANRLLDRAERQRAERSPPDPTPL